MYADQNRSHTAGIIFLAYPANSNDSSASKLPILSIYGELDGLTKPDEIDQTKWLLPADTMFHEITRGNHAQFGIYGEQSGDNEATIKAVAQQDEMVRVTLEWLELQE